jgi:hypothetical protein
MSEALYLQERPEAVDDQIRRYQELKRQRISIDNELRALVAQMRHGVCEVCGNPFTRLRPTKKTCSQQCNIKAYQRRLDKEKRGFDRDLIRAALPAIEAAHLLTPRALNVVRDFVDGNDSPTTIKTGEQFGISHQRVSQLLARANKLAKMVSLVQAATHQERVS